MPAALIKSRGKVFFAVREEDLERINGRRESTFVLWVGLDEITDKPVRKNCLRASISLVFLIRIPILRVWLITDVYSGLRYI